MYNATTAIDELRKEKTAMEHRILEFIDGEAKAFEAKTGISPSGYSVYVRPMEILGKAKPIYIVELVSVDIDI